MDWESFLRVFTLSIGTILILSGILAVFQIRHSMNKTYILEQAIHRIILMGTGSLIVSVVVSL